MTAISEYVYYLLETNGY